MKRQHSPTSKAGEEFIKPFRPSHKQKIVEGLEKLRVGGTHEEIADAIGMRADQIWKRMNECEKDGTVFNTGVTRKLKSGVPGIVWQVVCAVEYVEVKPDKEFIQKELF